MVARLTTGTGRCRGRYILNIGLPIDYLARMQNLTIVSACDRNYLWGAWLLAASSAKFLKATPVHILQTGFTQEDTALLEQFPTVKVLPLADNDPRNVANRKSEALLSADTDYVAWLDADCLVVGDISELLIPVNGEFQIRMRGAAENAWVWRNHYAPGEAHVGLPKSVRDKWQADVGQRTAPLTDTTCVTNAFVLHRRHLDFVRQWKSQIAKVIPPSHAGVVDHRNPAYFMTDESVMSSLLVFSDIAPPISEYRLDDTAGRFVAHFGANPKPWVRWNLRHWYCHGHVMELLDWVKQSGYRTPPMPVSLEKTKRTQAHLLALANEAKVRVRATAGKCLRLAGIKKK